jgi:hypothetical protein
VTWGACRKERLIDGVRGKGRHAIVRDGRFDDGQPVPSGVYFARLKAGSACFNPRKTTTP